MFDLKLIRMLRSGAVAVLAFVLPIATSARSNVTLAWNGSNGNAVAGYRIYSGFSSQTYASMLDVGNATTATMSGLVAGMTYYFAVTAYDIAGLESTFSSEINYTVPFNPSELANLGLSFTETGSALLTGTAPAGYEYEILTSADLSNWGFIGSVVVDQNGTFQFATTNTPSEDARYYRLRQTMP